MPRSQEYLDQAADRIMITDLLARYVWAIDWRETAPPASPS